MSEQLRCGEMLLSANEVLYSIVVTSLRQAYV